MAQKEIVSLDREDEIAMNELTDKLGQELKRVNKTTNQPILDEESKLKFEYAGFVPDMTDQEGNVTIQGGLTFYTRSQDRAFSRARARENISPPVGNFTLP